MLSASLRAEPAGLPVTLRIRAFGQPTVEQTVTTTAQWARYALPFRPAGAAVCVHIEARLPDGQPRATLWVDGVRLAPGDEREFAPAFPVEVGVSTGREGNWYRLGEPLSPSATLANAGTDPETVTLRWWCDDFFGRRGAERRETVTLRPDATRRVPMATQITEAGFYRLHTVLAGRGWEQRRDDRLAVILPIGDDPEQLGFVGLNHPFVSDLFMRVSRRLGAGWARLWAAKWNDVEPEQGRWTFDETDAQLRRNQDLGYRTLLCLATPSAGWASSAPAEVSGTTEAESEPRRHWWRPRSFDDYQIYVATVVRRYRRQVNHWEVFNEPVEVKGGPQGNLDMAANYARFLEIVRGVVEQEDPDGAVLGCGLGYLHSQPDLDAVLRRMQILSEHRYPGFAAPAGLQDDLDETAARLHRANPIARIWITEYGVYADDDPDPTTLGSRFMVQAGDQSERKAAVRVAQHLVCARAAGVATVFFHIGNWPFLVNFEHGCGFHPFFEYAGVPRKTGVAVNAAAWHLAGAKPVARPANTAELTAYEFQRGGATLFVVWSSMRAETGKTLRAALAGPSVTIRHVAGGRCAAPEKLDDSPLYVAVTNAAEAMALRNALEARSRG
ncbi:MAG: hypothetical protein HYU66_20650 [Armatimonadetes bacterium]|nr:hypothetical protein [Armatimonadota bacterium]